MKSRPYYVIRGIARQTTLAVLVTAPLAALYLLEGWTQTW